jgi:DNA-binding winged helix-turn-helix (wHTH) protein/TolB-like protein
MVRFGVFTVDQRTGEVRKAGVRVPLQEQPFRVLTHLLAHAGDIVTREELQRELWPQDTFVDFEHGLNVAIKRLRDALADDADAPRFVETLPRRGYRFIAPVVTGERLDEPVSGAFAATPPPAARTRRRVLAWAASAALALACIGAAMVLRRPRPALADRGTIVVADFVNTTGDAVFDGSLRQGLTVELAQSPSFVVVSRERVREALTRMTRSPDEPVTGQVAREACERVGAKVAVSGSIARLDEQYVIGLEAVDCFSGETVARDQVVASRRDSVLGALSAAASKVRSQLGESIGSLRQFDVPLEQATTSSVDALKAYTIAEDLLLRTDNRDEALAFLKRALELDPDFAMAYALLSSASSGLGRRDDEVTYGREAYARRQRATEAERFYIEGRYCGIQRDSTARDDCFMKVHELWKRTYPNDWLPNSNLAAAYLARGRYAEALQFGLDAVRLNPNEGFGYIDVIDADMALNRFDDAMRATDAAIARHISWGEIRLVRFELAFVANDGPAMAAERKAMADMEFEPFVVEDEGAIAAFGGRLRQAHARWTDAERLFDKHPLARERIQSSRAMADAAAGLCAGAAHIPVPGLDIARARLGITALLCGNQRRADALLSDDSARNETAPLVTAARALLAVDTNDPLALERLSEKPMPANAAFEQRYVRGLAYLRLHDAASAAAEFQWIADHRGIDPTSVFYPLAYVQHARVSILVGDVSTARRDYETFLHFWKDADRDVPILQQANSEYAALQSDRR